MFDYIKEVKELKKEIQELNEKADKYYSWYSGEARENRNLRYELDIYKKALYDLKDWGEASDLELAEAFLKCPMCDMELMNKLKSELYRRKELMNCEKKADNTDI